MDTLVSKYANSASSASFDNADNLGENLAGWDAATKFALPAFDIPMVANVCSRGTKKITLVYLIHHSAQEFLSDFIPSTSTNTKCLIANRLFARSH